jgi:inosine triphosphate pyrophosphatase
MTPPTEARHIVNFITGNANKLGEVKAILEPAIQVESQTLDLIEIQGTLEEVTLDKCRRAAELVRSGFLLFLLPRERETRQGLIIQR